MSTQSNTLPAIRALLWERWRVMRWVGPGAAVLGVPVAAYLAVVWSEVIYSYWMEPYLFGVILALLASGALLIHGSSHSGYTVRVPSHLLRLPVSNRLIAKSSISLTLLFSFGASIALLYAMRWISVIGSGIGFRAYGDALPLWGTLAAPGFVLSATAFSVGLYTLVALSSLKTPVLAVSIPALFWLTFGLPAQLAGIPIGGLPDRSATMAILWAWAPCVAIILASYPMGTAMIGRARSNLRGAAAIGALREVRSRPPRNHPLWARVWFEWRTWGRSFVLFASVIALTTTWLVPLSVGVAEIVLDGQGSEGVFGAACVLGLVLLLMDTGKGGAKGLSLTWTTPVTTRLLYKARLLTAIGAASVSVVIGLLLLASTGLFSDAPVGHGRWGTDWTLGIYLFALVMAPVLLLGIGPLLAGAAFLTAFAALYEGVIGGSYPYNHPAATGKVMNYAVAALLVLSVIYIAIRSYHARVIPLRETIALGALAVFMTIGAIVIEDYYRVFFVSSEELNFAAFAFLALIWHPLWLHRCRHGGLGWRMGRGR